MSSPSFLMRATSTSILASESSFSSFGWTIFLLVLVNVVGAVGLQLDLLLLLCFKIGNHCVHGCLDLLETTKRPGHGQAHGPATKEKTCLRSFHAANKSPAPKFGECSSHAHNVGGGRIDIENELKIIKQKNACAQSV